MVQTRRRRRAAARVVVLDDAGAVFLLRHVGGGIGLHWAMPGGGLEAGETPLQGARRELREETGWSDVEPTVLLWTWTRDYTRGDARVRQQEHIFLVTGPRREPVGDLTAMHRQDGIVGWRWWQPTELAELASRGERVLPPQLPGLLAELRRDGPPPTARDLGHLPPLPR
jgi:8-oxo-dGTP pyrophosphatase MutT (NUDIX family)